MYVKVYTTSWAKVAMYTCYLTTMSCCTV